MKKVISFFIIAMALVISNIALAAPIQTNQAAVKGLTLRSSMAQVEQVMGKPYRVGHYYMENYWGGYNDTMYEYPGVNFVFKAGYGASSFPMIKIILDSPQAALDNGLKVGMSIDEVKNVYGSGYSYSNGEIVYDFVANPATYELGKITFVLNGGAVKKIKIEQVKD